MSERDVLTRSSPDCPSEAMLDAYELGELRGQAGQAIGSHIADCPHCQGKLRERQDAFRVMPRRNEIVRAVHVAVAATSTEAPAPKRWLAWATAATAAAVVAIAPSMMRQPAETTDGLRPKGTVGLSVFVEREGRVEAATSGDDFHPGERLRFEIDLPRDAEVLIVGREASGRMYNAFPVGVDVVRSQPFRLGADQVLPGAVLLDASLGRETLYLVICKTPFDSRQVKLKEGRIETPTGCSTTPFVLNKVGT